MGGSLYVTTIGPVSLSNNQNDKVAVVAYTLRKAWNANEIELYTIFVEYSCCKYVILASVAFLVI